MAKILAPLDGTEIAEAGLRWAERAAKRAGASIHLLTVISKDQPDLGESVKEAETYLQSHRRRLQKTGLTVKIEVAVGEPAQAILEHAEAADVMVLSSGTVRWLISPILDRVLEKMTRPIIVVRASAGRAPRIPDPDKILVALDEETYSRDILPVVQKVANAVSASLVLCHVVAPILDVFGQPWRTDEPNGAAASLEKAKVFANSVAQQLRDEGTEVETIVGVGDPPGEIVRAAQRSGAGLIALTTRGRDHLDSRLVGSTANAILHSTRLPCLLTRRAAIATESL